MSYLMKGAKEGDFTTIHATHPALPGTYVCYAFAGVETSKEPVILWAVLSDGTPEPITINGVWDGANQQNSFVLFPDGRCARYEQSWRNEAEAVAELRQFDRSLP